MLSECPQCGQKLRTQWIRCPQCRLLLPQEPAAAEGGADSGGITRLWIAWGAFALAAIVLAVLVVRGGGPSPAASPARDLEAPPAPVLEAAAPVADPGTALEIAGSGGAIASFDAKRQGSAAYVDGDYATALARFEAAVAASPDDPEARNNLGQLLVRQGRATDALPHFDVAVRLASQQWSYRFNRARAYGLLDRWPDAIADYRAAAELFPGDHATLYNLGLACLRVRDYPAAIAALEQAVAAAPEQHDFLISLASAYVGSAQPDRARATFERFLELAPDDAQAPRVKAVLQSMQSANPPSRE